MNNKTGSLLTIGFSILSLLVKAQEVSVPMQYYDRVQHTRDKASDLWGKKDPNAAEISKSIAMLEGAVRLLDSVPVEEMAEGNIYLEGRRHDVYMDLVSAYAVAKEKDLAFEYLDKMYNEGSYSSGVLPYLEKDSSFMNLRDDQRYSLFIGKLKRVGDFYGNVSFRTPYKPDLSEDEKVAGLSLLWMMARNNFVYFDHVAADWNQTYLDYLPLVRKTKTTADFYKVLIRFYAGLNDGHTNVYVPDALSSEFYARPPMRARLIEGRVFLAEVFNDSLMNMGIKPGLEILKIDSLPVMAYAEKNIKPYESSSTRQDMQTREFYYALFAGPAKDPITFEFKDRSGKLFTKVIARTGYHANKYPNSVVYQNINNIGYLQVNEFESEDVNKQVDSLFKNEIPKTKGLIIDVRYNGGGSSSIGYNIISKLTDTSFKTSASRVIKYFSRPGEELEWDHYPAGNWSADGKIYYDKPVVVLISPQTFSAAEDFVVAFDHMKRGKLIGGPTGGSTGQPILFSLPGGGSARICAKRDTYPDGREFIGKGIMPDITVTNTVKDLMSGTDAVKDKAIELLSK